MTVAGGQGVRVVNVAPYAAGAMQFIGNQMDVASHGIWCEAGAQVVGNFFCESTHAPERGRLEPLLSSLGRS